MKGAISPQVLHLFEGRNEKLCYNFLVIVND